MIFSGDTPWVIFKLIDQQFAVSAANIKEMVAMPKVVGVPQTPDYIRGVINLRGQVFPVIDLRLKLGMNTLSAETDELIQLLEQREQDHKNWIAELESSVKEKRTFTLATDPHKCAFGKWYDYFRTDNHILAHCLKKFDEPHKKIHSIASKVKEYESRNDYTAALGLISRTKEAELAEMMRLFSEARSLLKEEGREIALVLECDEMSMAVSVDSVETVERLSESEIGALPQAICTRGNGCIGGIGKRHNGTELVQLMDVGKVIGQEDLAAIQVAAMA